MAEKTAATDQKLETYAFRLFSDRSAAQRNRRPSESAIVECFQDAELFLSVASKVVAGEIDIESTTGPQLADASAPNLKPNHPVNLVSQRFAEKNGGEVIVVNRIKAIAAELNKRWPKGMDPADDAVLSEIDGFQLNWTKPEINTARNIIPAYVTN